MAVLRICHPHNYKDIYEFDEKRNLFTGPVGLIINDVLFNFARYFEHAMPNTSFEIHPSRGIGELQPGTSKFDGCIGEMQNNQSDFILMLFEYPFEAVNVSSALIAYETFLVIGGMYDQVSTGGATQFLYSFGLFSPVVWLNCLMFVLSIYMILSTYNNYIEKNRFRYNLYSTIAHCTGYGSISSGGFLRCLLFMMSSIFSFVTIAYFASIISTQLVVIRDPDVFHTYQDVMDKRAVPLFINGMAYDEFFKKPIASPLRKKFWQYTVNNFKPEDLYVDMDPIALLLCAMKMVLREAVMIMEAPIMQVLPGSGCPIAMYTEEGIKRSSALIQDHARLKPLMEGLKFDEKEQKFLLDFTRKNPMDFSTVPDFNFHISTDPDEEKFSQSLLLAENSDTRIRGHLIKVNRRLIEAGYPLKVMRTLDRYNLLKGNELITTLMGYPDPSRKQKVENCFSESVILPEAHVDSVTFDNLWSLMVTMGSIYASVAVIVVIESIVIRFPRRAEREEEKENGVDLVVLSTPQFTRIPRNKYRHRYTK